MALPGCPARHPRDLLAAQIQPRPTMANKPACPSRLAEGTPTALLPGKQQANKPSALLTVLPALGRQHGNFQGDALRNTSPFSPTGNREGPTIPSQSPKNYTFGSLNSNQRSPRCSYHRNRQGPRHFRDFKATASLPPDCNDHQHTAAVLRAISRTSTNAAQPAAPPGRSFGPTLHQRDLWAPLHPMAGAARSAKEHRGGFCPPRVPWEMLAAGSGPGAERERTQLSFKALRVPHLRCEPLKSFFLLCFVFFFSFGQEGDKLISNKKNR